MVTWSCKITWQTKNTSATTVSMSIKLGWMVTNLERLLPIILLYRLVCVFSRDHLTNLKHISTNKMLMTTKLGRGVTYHERVPPIKSHDPWITWSCKIMWQTKAIISPLPWWQLLQNLAAVRLTMRVYP